MTIKYETQIRDFDFWMDAQKNTQNLTPEEWGAIEAALESCYPK